MSWQETLGRLYRMLFINPHSSILDLGTGFSVNLGLLVERTPNSSRIWSVDPGLFALDNASKMYPKHVSSGRVVLKHASAEELPFGTGFFDYVASAITFHHIAAKEQALRELERVMKPRALGILSDWGPGGSAYSPHSAEHLERSMEEVLQLLPRLFRVRTRTVTDQYYLLVFEK